ncbi:pyridine nucleotide-disulfide oxidoreductase [Pseudidiomarina aestuarii]|uniref:Pyridine nucleotide-disulfide oxidoreductase n=1 Tax=Pseudidiomarina aestuarii TaxID=624146 RepID=A0A7Z6ZVR8_9GAMM|nr:pyridine nucleotide-disulfide oxidoreductase [Pseudidiomarina aestuarii]
MAVLIIAAIAASIFFDVTQYLTLEQLKQQQNQLASWRDEHMLVLFAAYFGVYVLATALSIPGAIILTLGAGAVFGLGLGLLLASFASTLGATLAFLSARYLFRDSLEQRFSKRLESMNQGIERDGAWYLATLRLVPLFPFWMINLLMGVTRIRLWTYYWVSQVGMLAGTAVYVNAGTQLAQVEQVGDIVSFELLLSFILLGVFPLIAKWLVGVLKARKVYQGFKKPRRFDDNLLVIGAGSGGLVSAYIAAAVKAKVTLVEKHKMGGDCLNTGCVPSKALLHVAHGRHAAAQLAKQGAPVDLKPIQFTKVMESIHDVIRAIEPHDSPERYESLGVNVVQGHARLVSPWEVEITDANGTTSTRTAKSIVLATGARPFVPPIPGLDSAAYVTSDNLWGLREQPQQLVVLGGGPIGAELAQAFARLGTAVTVVEMQEQLLPREDADVAALVKQQFEADGIQLRLGWKAVEVQTVDTQTLVIERDGQRESIACDLILVAVGRAANLTGYGLEELGIETERTIVTNGFLQTTMPNIYAVGDVAGPYQFTHTASHQAWYAAVNGLFSPFKKFKADYSVIPWATFIQPEIATVGHTERSAQAASIDYELTTYGIDDLDRAIADDAAYGMVKVLTVPGKDKIIGATIVGAHSADLLAEFVLAMKHGLGLKKILGTIHIYPTMAEANKFAAGNWQRAHAPERVLAWLASFHRWRRGGKDD